MKVTGIAAVLFTGFSTAAWAGALGVPMPGAGVAGAVGLVAAVAAVGALRYFRNRG